MTDEFDRAEKELLAAERACTTIDGAERLMCARRKLRDARWRRDIALLEWSIALAEQCKRAVANGNAFVAVRQAAAKFVPPPPTWPDDDGWKWPVVILQTGWANGSLEDMNGGGAIGLPHYFPTSIVAQVAQAANGARFRRNHPETGTGADQPELTVGWLSDCQMQGSAAVGTVSLLKSAGDVRALLLAAREAGRLDLFGTSIMGYFGFTRSTVEGRAAVVASSLLKFIALDLVAEAGAGGKFVSA